MKKVIVRILIVVVLLVILSFVPLPVFGENCDFEGGACVWLNFWQYVSDTPTVL